MVDVRRCFGFASHSIDKLLKGVVQMIMIMMVVMTMIIWALLAMTISGALNENQLSLTRNLFFIILLRLRLVTHQNHAVFPSRGSVLDFNGSFSKVALTGCRRCGPSRTERYAAKHCEELLTDS
ncbi:hypothetical protein PanWU01x14_114960 [Parasponia andersonii]|uniref:Transmembrane protein n=1 Tax=Parasponia andersonii TaxID=3476 RepID=A0A2P5CXH7_PARAD|nr:hypothetical protein PanWU01x14_114960 [Parasponia andersonii]